MTAVDEGNELPDILVALARRQVPAKLRSPAPAVVARRFADGVGAYAVRPAEREFLRGIEVLVRPLAAVREVERETIVYVLQARQVQIPLAEMTCRPRGSGIVPALHFIVDGEVAIRVIEREGVAAARPDMVEVVAIDADDPVFRSLRILVRHALRFVLKILPVEAQRAVEVEVAAAPEVVLPPKAHGLRRARVVKRRERAAQRVVRACVADADAFALLGDRRRVGSRSRPHAAVRHDAADGEEVALAERTRVVEEGAVLVASRVAIAAVVDADVAPHAVALVLDVDDDVRRALAAARLDLCARLDARKVVRQPDAAVERRFLHEFARGKPHLAPNGIFCQIRIVVHDDLVVAAGHDREVDRAVCEVLRREVGEGNEVSFGTQVFRDLRRLLFEVGETRVLELVRL